MADTTQKIGWSKEATAGVDPISTNSSDYWLHGINVNKFEYNHPIERHNFVPSYRGNARYPAELRLVSTEAVEVISFFPVNLIPFYHILATGATHAVAANDHTIDPSAPGTALETYTVRSESTGGTAGSEKYISMTGCKTRVLTINFNRMRFGDALSAAVAYTGFSSNLEPDGTALPALAAAHNGAKLPATDGTMTGTQTDTLFRHDTNFEFKWDSDADNVDYDDDLLNFNCQLIQNYIVEGKEGQARTAYVTEGSYTFLFGFQLLRGNFATSDSIYDDFKASTSPTDEHFIFKIYAGSTNYLQLEFMDVGINQCQANYAHFEEPKLSLPTWDVMGIAENIQVKGRDGLDPNAAQNKYYGESL